MAKRKFQSAPRGGTAPKPRKTRLSQCMIVKNEEKNIERALTWGKGRAMEQIVVDTGSTDRTVEIAERMGARVYHFEWIDDFSAAKNYAMDLCKGDWIAILDADEWFSEKDADILMYTLSYIDADPKSRDTEMLTCDMVHLDDDMKPFMSVAANRIFRNRPHLRYAGAIHERVPVEGLPALRQTDISILHTGYQQSAFEGEGNKTGRNIKLIRAELERNPDDMMLKTYLADSLHAAGGGENLAEARRLYAEAMDSEEDIHPQQVHRSYQRLVLMDMDEGNFESAEKRCRRGLERLLDSADIRFLLGQIMHNSGRLQEAWEEFKKCEELVEARTRFADYISANMVKLFGAMTGTAHKLGDVQNTVKYAALTLKADKMQIDVLSPLMNVLKNTGNASDGEILAFVEKLYDFSSLKDKIFTARAAKNAGLVGLRDMIMERITPEEREMLSGGGNG